MNGRGSLGGLVSEEYLDVTIGDVLLCPLCLKEYPDGRGMWLHQTGVEAFFRDEDHEKGVHGYIADTKSFLTVNGDCGNTSRNPSSRRDGLIIYFFCEWCSEYGGDEEGDENNLFVTLELHISQHKGVTAMGWLVKKYRSHLNAEIESVLRGTQDRGEA
jgi:hypothetical protein